MERRALAAALLLLLASSAYGAVDLTALEAHVGVRETATNAKLTRTKLTYVAPLCLPDLGSSSLLVYTCRSYWTILFDRENAAGATGLRLSVYTNGGVEKAADSSVVGVKAGANAEDAWNAAWNADWAVGKGVPGDKTYQLLVPQSTLGSMDVPYHLFAQIDPGASSSDAEVPVSFWTAQVTKFAVSSAVSRTGWIPSAAPAFAARACYGMFSDADRPEVCNRVRAEVRLTGAAGTYQLSASLYGASQLGPDGQPRADALPAATRTAALGPSLAATFLFGQALPGESAGGDAGPVTALVNLTSPYVFLSLPLAVFEGANGSVPFAATVASAGSAPSSSEWAARCAAYAGRADPLGRFTLQAVTSATAYGVPVWAIVLILAILAISLVLCIGVTSYRWSVAKRRAHLEQAMQYGNYGGQQYIA